MDYDGQLFLPTTTWEIDGGIATFGISPEAGDPVVPYGRNLSIPFQNPVRDLVRLGEAYYFIGATYNAPSQFGLWTTNPATKATAMIRGFRGNEIEGGGPFGLTVVDETLYFAADAGSGHELWTSDGTAEGTVLFREIRDGDLGSNPAGITSVKGGFLFRADDGGGDRVWFSDGTGEGTAKLAEDDPRQAWRIVRGAAGLVDFDLEAIDESQVSSVHAHRNLWFFRERPSQALWVTNGSDEQTYNLGLGLRVVGEFDGDAVLLRKNEILTFDFDSQELKSIAVLPAEAGANRDSDPFQLTATATGLFWISQHDGVLHELDAATGEVRSHSAANRVFYNDVFNDATAETFPQTRLESVGDQVFIYGKQGLSVIDTATNVEQPIPTESAGGWESGLLRMTSSDEMLYFTITMPSRFPAAPKLQVWESDGTVAGTKQIAENIPAASFSWNIEEPQPTYANGSVFFLGVDSELWVATLDGEHQRLGVKSVSGLSVMSDEVFALRNETNRDTKTRQLELWKSDGSLEGTQLIREIPTSVWNFDAPSIAHLDGKLIFADGEGGLYRSDGTTEGTELIRQFPPSTQRSNSSLLPCCLTAPIQNFESAQDQRFFTVDDGVHGNELWVTDGTDDGTRLAADIRPGQNSSLPTEFTVLGDQLFFSVDDGEHGRELWNLDFESATLHGDIDGNGEVNFVDFLFVSDNFGQDTEQGLAGGDVYEDGRVDFRDFLIVSANFGRRLGP